MSNTEFVRWGNGGDGPEAGYSRSLIPGYITAQQFGAFIGTNQGTARDHMSGRGGKKQWGEQFGNAWFISYKNAMEWAAEYRQGGAPVPQSPPLPAVKKRTIIRQ